ncbi:MAG: protein translocase subunit SecF [Candidatus Pacebacteria bacterium]|nr:protein translocase subunit SecF [Candidatus Paceibacterota bacterium]
MKYKKLYFFISAIFLIPGLISLMLYGLKPAIDFAGGSLLEINLLNKESSTIEEQEELKNDLQPVFAVDTIQTSGPNSEIFRGKEISNEAKEQALAIIEERYGEIELLRFESIGPVLGQELLKKAINAVLIVAGVIIIYIWQQFHDLKYGISAVLAMFHDTLILLGIFSLLGHFSGVEVDVLFITAVLTSLSFSIHDTIVVYNRIRELKKTHRQLSLTAIANLAVGKTLSRSINDSLTIIIMLLSLVLLGGESIRYFSLALLIGAITGTYSSSFIAVPILLVWEEISNKRAQAKSN